ncbi:MAG: response regulator transcription factor [Ignavibacteriaceae bacterium]|nr:response regulator transcription factor [Ignavibacteriaceae bacterium]
MIKILIADDHAIVREGLKQILAEEPDMKVTGEAGDANELFGLLKNDVWDAVVLDINMPGKSGLEALKDLKKEFADLPVLILSMYSEEQYGIRALKAGASGYLKKASAPNEFVTALRTIIKGKKYISPSLAENLADNINPLHPLSNKLSDREYEILCKIAQGHSTEDIANELCISVHTVYTYRNRILDKLNLKTNVELTQYAIQNKLIEL